MSNKPSVGTNTNDLLLSWHQGLADLVATLYSSVWDTCGYDVELRRGISAALSNIPAIGVIGHLSGRIQLVHFNPHLGLETTRLRAAAIKELERVLASQVSLRFNKPIRFQVDEAFSGVIVIFPDETLKRRQPRYSADISEVHSCCMIYSAARVFPAKFTVEEEDRFVNFHANTTLPLLFDAFRHRERRFSPFAVRVSQQYWDDSLKFARLTQTNAVVGLKPPWEGTENMHRTATVCIDLRKSTFCMDHSDSPDKFGQWLDSLVKLVTEVGHAHGGTFDKFTGDGGLIHFLDHECREIYGLSGVECAVKCAKSMQGELKGLLDQLRKFIRFDSGLLGAGVAVDVGDAYWSLDHRDNPIVVGRAVVGACRVCDGAKAGKIRLTNIACKELPKELLLELLESGLKQVSQSTKELDKDMEILVWEV